MRQTGCSCLRRAEKRQRHKTKGEDRGWDRAQWSGPWVIRDPLQQVAAPDASRESRTVKKWRTGKKQEKQPLTGR